MDKDREGRTLKENMLDLTGIFSCKPVTNTFKIEKTKDGYVLKWQCDTIGFHEIPFETYQAALEHEVKMLKQYWPDIWRSSKVEH